MVYFKVILKYKIEQLALLQRAIFEKNLVTFYNIHIIGLCTSCYVQYWPENLIPWAILCFQSPWVIGGPYYSSRNFFYLAVFEIADLVGIFSSKTEAFSPKGELFYS